MTSQLEQTYFQQHTAYVEFVEYPPDNQAQGVGFGRLQGADRVIELILHTAAVRRRAISHRGFLVSAGAWACKQNTIGRVLGYNIKPWSHDEVNIHAEDIVDAKVVQRKLDAISVLCVIGDPQPDKVTGKQSLTLPPCGQRCRPRLAANPRIRYNTLIVCANAALTHFQFTNMESLIRWQEYDDDSGVMTFSFDQRPEILRPLPKHQQYFTAEDTDFDDTDWRCTIERWLNNRTASLYGIGRPYQASFHGQTPLYAGSALTGLAIDKITDR